ncbi:MAG: mobile mystery protein A [Gemmatimonadaceae bacterium]|nr:mobile mystery protein A [Gemmatimonadaceae bacterium]MDQ3243495.1 mobile mystery protein A [Gemmatimonadota bacterium]
MVTPRSAEFNRLRIRQLDESLDKARQSLQYATPPRDGWIREIRHALGMTSAQLAKRLGITQPNALALEDREKEGRITLNSLMKAAEALDCEVAYFLVPRQGLETTLRNRLKDVLRRRLTGVAHTMALEEQAVSKEHLEEILNRSVEELMTRPPRGLWG